MRSPAAERSRTRGPGLPRRGDDGERRAAAERDPLARATANAPELADRAEPDQHRRLELASLHVGVEVRAPGDEHGRSPVLAQRLRRVVDAARRQVRKRRQSHHDANGRTAMAAAGAPNADWATT